MIPFTFLTICQYGQSKESTAVDSLFAEWDKTDTPGCAIGIIKDGEMIYSNGYGIGDLEHDISLSPSSIFYIGSVSKQFVTFCILLLEEQGKINLDNKIQKYLPDFPEYGSSLTIRHFIHHTSGVRDFLTLLDLKGFNYLDHIERDEVYELIKRQKVLNFPPGDQYLYSNSCYFMLALVIEKVSGQTLSEFAKKNIFMPLGMTSTIFYDDNNDIIKNRVFSYEKSNTKDGFNNLIMRFDLVGSGGVYSSINDLFLWDQNFYHNKLGKGGQNIIQKMHEEGLLNNGKSSRYAYALINSKYKGLRTVSHGGALAGYRSVIVRFPDQKFSIIILCNRSDADPSTKAMQIADIYLKDSFVESTVDVTTPLPTESVKKDTNVDLTKIDINKYTGNYYSEELDINYTLFIDNEIFKVKIGNHSLMTLNRNKKDQFMDVESGLIFRFTRKGNRINGFNLDAGRVTNLLFKKQ